MRRFIPVTILCFAAAVAAADSFRERLNAANEMLRKGDPESALDLYRDLRVDEPESPELQYNTGCAKYQEALRAIENDAAGPEENPFEEARASFQKALATGSGPIRQDSAFNSANCLAQYAKHLPPDADQQVLVDAYQQSISAYEDVLRQFPDHQGAQNNLDHMRYLLKKMLQNPPQPQDQEGKGENQPQDQQQQQDEQQPEESPNPQQGNENEQQADQNAQSQDQEDQEQEPEPNQGDNEENQENEQTQTASESDDRQDDHQSAEATESAEVPDDRQTIEALLQSLEDRDQMEQRAVRRQPGRTRLKEQWW